MRVALRNAKMRRVSTTPAPSQVRRKQRLLAFALGWLAVELVLPFVGRWLPLRVRARIPAPMYVLSQASSAHAIPDDYVLVLGDSYAEGQGDWLSSAMREPGSVGFQATDVLHARSGRDVITFGRGGADNVSSTAYMVEKRFAALTRMGLGTPSDVFVYFYEGNDLTDNLRQARKHFELDRRGFEAFDERALDLAIEARARDGFWSGLPGAVLLPYLVIDALKHSSDGGVASESQSRIEILSDEDPLDESVFTSGGQRYAFRGDASGPALELNPQETEFALRMFERALAWTVRRFPKARVRVVYIPAPLSCYELSSTNARARVTQPGREKLVPSTKVKLRSDELRARVAAISASRHVALIDATDELRAASATEVLHGPIDGHHFNRAGYTVLGEVLARALATDPR